MSKRKSNRKLLASLCAFGTIGSAIITTTFLGSCSVVKPYIKITGDNIGSWSTNTKIYTNVGWQYYYDQNVSVSINVTSGYEQYVQYEETVLANQKVISYKLIEPASNMPGFDINVKAEVPNSETAIKKIHISDFQPASPVVDGDLEIDLMSANIAPSDYSAQIPNYLGCTTFNVVTNNYKTNGTPSSLEINNILNALKSDFVNTGAVIKDKFVSSFGTLTRGEYHIAFTYDTTNCTFTKLTIHLDAAFKYLWLGRGELTYNFAINSPYILLAMTRLPNNSGLDHSYPDKSKVMGNFLCLTAATIDSSYTYSLNLDMSIYSQKYQHSYQSTQWAFALFQEWERYLGLYICSWYLGLISNPTYPNVSWWNSKPHLTITNYLYPSDDKTFSDLFMNLEGALLDKDTVRERKDLRLSDMNRCISENWRTFTIDGVDYQWWNLVTYSKFEIVDKQPSLQLFLSEALMGCYALLESSDITYISNPG